MKPILCNPYDEPDKHWHHVRLTQEMVLAESRRSAGYWFKTERTARAQREMFGDEEFEELPLVNVLRDDVRKWRDKGYPGASTITRALLQHWASPNLRQRLFFCQREAVETLIYLQELLLPGKSALLKYKRELVDDDWRRIAAGERASFIPPERETWPTLVDGSLTRLGCKMATGSGKTVVMAMLIAWAFCNRGADRRSREFPHGVLVCCPNLTVKERLQVLRPEYEANYYDAFGIVPMKYRELLNTGKVLVTNWHAFAPQSEHVEGGKSYTVVNKGPETPETFARRVLGDLADRLPLLVLNDEGHHCWRPIETEEKLSGDELAEKEEATVWVDGLEMLNAANGANGIAACIDLSATPFYLKASGHPEGRPFPWLVSDFGLVDAIESGIVKIPRLPVLDTTGKPDAKYFRLWETITNDLLPAQRLPGRARKPKPEAIWSGANAALQQIAGQWVERFEYVTQGGEDKDKAPPVLIIVCDNTDIAEVFYREISGETEVENGDESDDDAEEAPTRGKKPKKKVICGRGRVFPDHFSNTATEKRTIRIDSKLLAEAESDDPTKKKSDAAEALRKVVATVGRVGQPGEKVRCVVSVAMLTEGWDANNVTHILGLRAFGSQLLCEQVVGRGLRRMDYTPDPATGLLTEEYVDVYGIPFTVIPYKGRASDAKAPEDKPKFHVRAMPERAAFEIRFPVVEGFAFALNKNLIHWEFDAIEPLRIEPEHEPTATLVRATVGFQEGRAATGPIGLGLQDRSAFYHENHLQTIQFDITRDIVGQLLSGASAGHRPSFARLSRHQLFPQVFALVERYFAEKVDFQGGDPSESGLERYRGRIVERLRDAIEPDASSGEPPLLPILNRIQPTGTTADVNFKTTRACRPTSRSHINQVVLDTKTWEASAAFLLEQAVEIVAFYARNDSLGLTIPYEFEGIGHSYEPDYLVRLASGVTLILEVKGHEDEQDRAKHTAARRWVSAVNNWGGLGRWAFHVCRNPQTLAAELRGLI